MDQWVEWKGNWQRSIGEALNGLPIGIQHIKQQTGVFRLLNKSIDVSPSKDRIWRHHSRSPCPFWFIEVDFDSSVVNVPAVEFNQLV